MSATFLSSVISLYIPYEINFNENFNYFIRENISLLLYTLELHFLSKKQQ